jgi:hypothetical protein
MKAIGRVEDHAKHFVFHLLSLSSWAGWVNWLAGFFPRAFRKEYMEAGCLKGSGLV